MGVAGNQEFVSHISPDLLLIVLTQQHWRELKPIDIGNIFHHDATVREQMLTVRPNYSLYAAPIS